jgi:thioredoxin
MKKIATILVILAAVPAFLLAGHPESKTPPVSKPIYLTKSEFIKRVMDYEKNKTQWVYKGDKPAIIDFYADWCGPCKKVAPALEELAQEYAGKVYIYKINIDQEKELAGLFGIRNIPAFLIIPKTGKPSMATGASANHAENKERFKKVIDDLLK